jgi:phage gpG-like protein
MPDAVGIRVEGADVLRRNLRKVYKDHPKGMKLIHQEIAGPVVAVAKRKARRLSGRMAGTIKPKSTTTMSRIEAGRGIEYAAVQHFGWAGHSISANPFLVDAINEKQASTVILYEKKLGAWIDMVWDDTHF